MIAAVCMMEAGRSSCAAVGWHSSKEPLTSVGDTVLQRVAAGDPAAVQDALDRYGGLVWSLARRFCYNQTEAEDAVQEIFIDLWKSAGRFDESIASEPTFVAMIARRRLIDRRRRISRRLDIGGAREVFESDGSTDDETGRIEIGEEATRAAAALGELKEDQQRVLRLSIYQGLSHERIAEATGLPLGTVKTHVRRGLMRLREILGSARPDRSADAVGSGGGGGIQGVTP
jgi:RNA polymerase sigma factor (sigma-70 family)